MRGPTYLTFNVTDEYINSEDIEEILVVKAPDIFFKENSKSYLYKYVCTQIVLENIIDDKSVFTPILFKNVLNKTLFKLNKWFIDDKRIFIYNVEDKSCLEKTIHLFFTAIKIEEKEVIEIFYKKIKGK